MNAIENWQEEQRSAYLYRICAQAEAGTSRAKLFSQLAEEALAQSVIWEQLALANGRQPPKKFEPDSRTKLVATLAARLGPRRVRPLLAAMKVRGMSVYNKDAGHAPPRADIAGEHRHRGLSGGSYLRAAVFGVNDGLVSNASLIFGVAGASSDPRLVLLTGIAGLTAGAIAMAAGEFVSVQSQRELFEYQIGLEREELEQYPEAEAQELAFIYQAKGLGKQESKRLATRLIADPERALDTLSREELGLNPDELGSPWSAAISSFASFGIGALIPLLPFAFKMHEYALATSGVLTAVALFTVGATLSLFTGRSAIAGGGRMLMLGAAAAALTYGVGRLFGVSVA